MTSPPRKIRVRCPECETRYEDWYRPSINLALDDFDEEYLRQATTATCPECGHMVDPGSLVVRADGTWELPTPADGEGPEPQEGGDDR